MKDEIKEILDKLEIVARKHTIKICEDGSRIETMSANVGDELRLNNYSSKLLLNYITNLQEEINKLTAESTEWESKCDNLQEELEVLNKLNQANLKQKQNYKSRNYKAIEYCRLNKEFTPRLEDVENILQGDDN